MRPAGDVLPEGGAEVNPRFVFGASVFLRRLLFVRKFAMPSCSLPPSVSLPCRVLFVCLGNICRSPAAEIIFRSQLASAGLEKLVQVDSCGTGSWHVGQKPDARMLAALKRAGYAYDGHRARCFRREDFSRFDLIIPQDAENRSDLLSMAHTPGEAERVVSMARWFPPGESHDEVPDPYYGGPEGFDAVVSLLERATRRLAAEMAALSPSGDAPGVGGLVTVRQNRGGGGSFRLHERWKWLE